MADATQSMGPEFLFASPSTSCTFSALHHLYLFLYTYIYMVSISTWYILLKLSILGWFLALDKSTDNPHDTVMLYKKFFFFRQYLPVTKELFEVTWINDGRRIDIIF